MEESEPKETFAITIKGDGISIEKSVSSQTARQLINIILGGGGSTYENVPRQEHPVSSNRVSAEERSSGPLGSPGPSVSPGRRVSLREFLDDAQAQRNPDKIVAIAEYLYVHDSIDLFTRDDIKGRFRVAGEAAPANFPRDFSWAVRNGWIAEDLKSAGSFYVTQKGRTAIENKFSGEIKKATSQPTPRKRSRKTNSAPAVGEAAE
ncbi:hypothetical protein [Chelativorans intermedius]|uniref:Restriction system protein Mrr-like N-terminal domain-containing protein n=1 Tax=Chelativorans intermedius TaxID=515947 RepID=A0ABV6D4V6_9HYPH|nr:hypothetical protein [Chelativorans intermedius]MCT8999010.1 hypothetical protein [Chelativorans intermedius]